MSTTKRSTDKDDSSSPSKDADKVPSGFVLKLFQMVNGAPDEIISWLPSGDAFRISDLERLENETLPTFFRHRRFQSLVRQLNFYNFRKVNRERTFWVYRHNLFHRDRPEELYLLRRRTCPGVDGRKQRPDMDIQSLEAGVRSNSPMRIGEDLSDADSVLSSTVATAAANGRRAQKHRKAKGGNNVIPEDLNDSTSMTGVGVGGATSRVKRGLNLIKSSEVSDVESASLSHYQGLTGKTSVDSSLLDTEEADKRSRVSVSSGDEDDEAYESKKRRLERSEQALLVNKVARQLDEHARRAGQKSVKRRVGTVTPPFSNDTMKYHALTYDDEIEIYRSEDIGNGGCQMSKRTQGHIIVTDGDDSDDDEYYAKHVEPATLLGVQNMKEPTKENEERFTSPPVSDMLIIADIAYKFRNCKGSEAYLQTNKEECNLAAAVAQFCMSTAPHDPMLGKKALQLMMGCDRLAQEFRLYKAALSPNSTPPSILSVKGKSQSVVIQQFFGKDTDKEAVRVFKAFVLNCLDDLVGGSNLAKAAQLTKSESHCLHYCVKTWFAGVVASS